MICVCDIAIGNPLCANVQGMTPYHSTSCRPVGVGSMYDSRERGEGVKALLLAAVDRSAVMAFSLAVGLDQRYGP